MRVPPRRLRFCIYATHAPRGDATTLGGRRTRVGHGTIPDPADKTSHELDVVVFGRDDAGRETLPAIGEAKSNDIVGRGHLQRLERLRELLIERDDRAGEDLKLLLFSGKTCNDELSRSVESRDDVELVGLDRLYRSA